MQRQLQRTLRYVIGYSANCLLKEFFLTKAIFLLTCVSLTSAVVFAQDPVPSTYQPLPPSGSRPIRGTLTKTDMSKTSSVLGVKPETLANINTVASDISAASTNPISPDPYPTCAQPSDPSGTYQYSQVMLSTTAAAKAGIPFFSVSGGGTQMVLVRDYLRAKTCLATDNKTKLLYGQTIRTIITIADYDGKIGTSLPVIAADATINRKNHRLNIVVNGFDNPKYNDVIAGLSAREFNVETYVQYLETQSQLIKLISDPNTRTSVERIGIVPEADESVLLGTAAMAFALQEIKDGKSCDQAKNDFRTKNDPSAGTIPSVYQLVTGACDSTSPNKQQRDKADGLLLGLKVKY